MTADSTADALVALSRWIDAGNAGRDPEAVTWGRLAKITEEAGEVIAAYIGATGQNPRKGITGTHLEVVEELLDVAVTALAAIEHLNGHDGHALPLLDNKILRVAQRAGVDGAASPAPVASRVIEESTGVDLIAAERRRQVEVEGYTAEHDDGHESALARAAACYAMPIRTALLPHEYGAPSAWPWTREFWKPTPGDRVRELVKAGALVAAAIDAHIAGDQMGKNG